MKTIATAALLMMLAVPAWAADAEKETNDTVNTNVSIVLSEAEMDGVSAGGTTVAGGDRVFNFSDNNSPFPQDRFFDAELGLELIRRY